MSGESEVVRVGACLFLEPLLTAVAAAVVRVVRGQHECLRRQCGARRQREHAHVGEVDRIRALPARVSTQGLLEEQPAAVVGHGRVCILQGHVPQLDAGPQPPAGQRGGLLVVQHDQARAAGSAQCCAQPGRVQDQVLDGAPQRAGSVLTRSVPREGTLVHVPDARQEGTDHDALGSGHAVGRYRGHRKAGV